MSEREEFDGWFDREFAGANVSEALRAVAFYFWCAGRQSLIAASGAAVELRALQEVR